MSSSSLSSQVVFLPAASASQDGVISTSNQTFSGIKTFSDGYVINNTMPALTGTQDVNQWLKSLRQLHIKNANTYTRAVQFATGASGFVSGGAYSGGVYSPSQNRVYLIPNNQANQTNWHYINCNTGAVVAYAHGATGLAASTPYSGGVYSPTQNRIYLVPNGQHAQSNWHYIDCNTGAVVAYAHGQTLYIGYSGGVYSPVQNRVYFVPTSTSSLQSNWHYIDCNTGAVVAYAHGATLISNGAYQGGIYSPTQNRIYLVPSSQANQTDWHYIDCNTGAVVAYAHGVSAVQFAYSRGVYSPTQNRIYLVPHGQANQTDWHYIDCNTGAVVAYAHGVSAGLYAYAGGVYSPTQNRIYLVPFSQSSQTNWHYIDCNTGAVIAYAHGVSAVSNAYSCGAYSPTENKIYFVPSNQANQANWHYLECVSDSSGINPHMFGSTILSSTF